MEFYLVLVAYGLLVVGNCRLSTNSPNGLIPSETPQLVMLTFDDNVNIVNFQSYEDLLMTGRKNKGNKCPIKATFFINHDSTNYQRVHELYRHGSEVAVHTISHNSVNSESLWQNEIVGMRTMFSEYAKIPTNEIKGFRAPFLQTSGNPTFRVLRDNGFTYDSSMPTRAYSNPPMWPYSLDRGFKQDCTIGPCPNETFEGLWEVPMVTWRSGPYHCSMVDACRVVPETEENILAFMKTNFLRHYQTNRAPFPFFLHESWFYLTQRKNAYFKFVDFLLEKDDVFLVTVSEVVDYVKNPVGLREYRNKICERLPLANNCESPRMCGYTSGYMMSCRKCPKSYPWIGNPLGL